MKLRILKEEAIDSELDRRILACLRKAFPDGAADFKTSRYWHGSMPAWTVLLEEDGCIIAHVGVVERSIRVGEETAKIAGLQNVFVVPSHRGRGFSDTVVRESMAEALRLNLDFGLLFCVPQIEKVYARCGWRTLSDRQVIRVDGDGREVYIPGKNIAMYHSLRRKRFPDGTIHLQGNDW